MSAARSCTRSDSSCRRSQSQAAKGSGSTGAGATSAERVAQPPSAPNNTTARKALQRGERIIWRANERQWYAVDPYRLLCCRDMRALCALSLVVMAGCASSPPGAAPSDPAAKTGANIAQAVTTPLSDLNLVNAPVPPALADAQRAPYGEPADGTCAGLTAAVSALDAVLGPDLDMPPAPGNPGLVERGAGLVGEAATQSVRGAAESVVPFRAWVRRLSGAERYSREVAAAIAAGIVRRAYLKGQGQVRGCAAPAAPAAPAG